MNTTEYASILTTIIDNGRVEAHEDGSFITESLRVETEYEATELGLSRDEIAAAVEFALAHSDHHE